MFTNRRDMGLPLHTWVEKTVNRVETPWLSGKEKVRDAVVSKEGDADNVLGHEKGATVNSSFYCQLLKQ